MIEDTNKDISESTNRSRKIEVFAILKRADYLKSELGNTTEELGMIQTRLQMLLESFFQSVEMLSNLAKKVSQTQQSIIQNFK